MESDLNSEQIELRNAGVGGGKKKARKKSMNKKEKFKNLIFFICVDVHIKRALSISERRLGKRIDKYLRALLCEQ